MEHIFKINLHGIIGLLSEHLYSGPRVYLRELLQNAVDAIRARELREPGHDDGRVSIELLDTPDAQPLLMLEDNGIGLCEEEVHRFLSVIGESSKTGDLAGSREDFIGQFGIGLLSCFMVSDEITVISKSVKSDCDAVMWCGRPDGTYRIEKATRSWPGTSVMLRCKEGAQRYFSAGFLQDTAAYYGGMLPYPIAFVQRTDTVRINTVQPPWRGRAKANALLQAYTEFGRSQLEQPFLDVVLLHARAGEVTGAAYILEHADAHPAKATHRVYLKNMLLSDTADNVLPQWTFFTKCIVNAKTLRPTASREALYEDSALIQARDELGRCLRDYFLRLAREDVPRLQKIIRVHLLAMKALAVEDDEFFRLIVDHFPFETTLGRMTLAEYKKHQPVLRYVAGLDTYRQIAQVAAAQSIGLINGGYVYDTELLEKHARVFPVMAVESVDVSAFSSELTELTPVERNKAAVFLTLADQVLQEFQCQADVLRFLPDSLPVLYAVNGNQAFVRSRERSKSVTDALWGGVLDTIAAAVPQTATSVYFNYNNSLVQKLIGMQEAHAVSLCVRTLYVQALMLGHHPLTRLEMAALNNGLIELIEWGMVQREMAWNGLNPTSLN